MPTLGQEKDRRVKMMLVGHSGTGKTAALIALVQRGYTLRIVDMDKGLEFLYQLIKQRCPERLGQVHYMTFRDKIKITAAGPMVSGTPKAFVNAVAALDNWEDGTKAEDWDEKTIIVVDSLTSLGRASYYWSRQMNPTFKDPRLWYAPAQDAVESVIANLTGDNMTAHVIVITHIDLREDDNGPTEGFPSSVGKALGPKLPRYFNTIVLAETSGTGTNLKRTIKTLPTPIIASVKVPLLTVPGVLPIDEGLGTLFDQLLG